MEIIHRINWVDVLVVILILRVSYVAFQEGLSHEIFPTIASILIVIISLHYYQRIGAIISNNLFNLPRELSNFLSFLGLSAIIGLVLKLSRIFFDKIIKVEWHPFVERFGGIIFGVIRASIITSLTLITIALVPLSYLQWSIRDKSVTGMYFLRIGPEIYDRAAKFLPTVKIEEQAAKKEELIKDLISDKTIVRKTKKIEKKKTEWEE